ncbi:unnamed protein product [Cochlearia groenlandica]
MANTCRISIVMIMILLLFINQYTLSSSARIRFIGDVNHKQRQDLWTHDDIMKAKANLDYLLEEVSEEEETKLVNDDYLGLPTNKGLDINSLAAARRPKTKDASAASLGTYSSKLFAMCDPQRHPIFPPRSTSPETSHSAEKAVVKAVLCGTGKAYDYA